MTDNSTLNWATPTDYDSLGDIVFDAVRNGPGNILRPLRPFDRLRAQDHRPVPAAVRYD
jgi:ATP phosphoribosyltransferase regulatory subunit HisZ